MAQIWRDTANAMNNDIFGNSRQRLRFKWDFVTFAGEKQEQAQLRYRKAGQFNSIMERITAHQDDLSTWSPIVHVWNHGFTEGGNITAIEFPIDTFTPGIWIFRVRHREVGATEWSGWATHKIEISEYDLQSTKYTSAATEVLGPRFGSEGTYGIRVEVMNSAGAITESNEQTFDVWSGSLYLHHGGSVQAVPVSRKETTGIKRVEEN